MTDLHSPNYYKNYYAKNRDWKLAKANARWRKIFSDPNRAKTERERRDEYERINRPIRRVARKLGVRLAEARRILNERPGHSRPS